MKGGKGGLIHLTCTITFLTGDSKQSATSVKHSNLRCSGEVMSPQQILDGTKRLSLETEVVSDCSPRTGEEMNDFLSKEPSEQREIQTTVIN